jgi:hypothetical protein
MELFMPLPSSRTPGLVMHVDVADYIQSLVARTGRGQSVNDGAAGWR